MESKSEIFFSYAWGDENGQGEGREKIVNELYQSLLKDGYHVIRDKNDLGYKGFISDFMSKIGEGQCVVMAISKKYFKSPYCMFEAYEIARNSNFDKKQFQNKVLPIMVESIDFTKPEVIKEYFEYWQNEYNEWNNLIKEHPDQISIEQLHRSDKVKMIYQNFGKLTDWIIDMNTMNLKILTHDNFAVIKKEIERMISIVPGNAKVYKLPNIRKFLTNALNDTELDILCMDHFEEVYINFAAGQNKSQKINQLLDFCRKNDKFNVLLEVMHEANMAQFEAYKPYV